VLLQLFTGSLYPRRDLVDRALAPGQSIPPAVLDVGTGSGAWAIDMANRFPHAHVIGMDICVPAVLERPQDIPSNCRFEIADANVDMDRYSNAFDVIHIRCAQAGVKDFDMLLYNAAQCLRPGGVLLLVGCVAPLLHEDCATVFPVTDEGQPGFTWYQTVWSTLFDALGTKGNYLVQSLFFWQKWLENNPNYVDVVAETRYMPLGPWTEDAPNNERHASELMRRNIIEVIKAHKALFMQLLLDEATVDERIQKSIKELEAIPYKGLIRWQFISAVRKDIEWIPRSEPPQDDLKFNPCIDWPPARPDWK